MMDCKKKMGWKPLLIIGFVLLAAQALPVIGNAKVNKNPWDSPTFLTGSSAQIGYDIISLIAYLWAGIVGLILVVLAITRANHKNAREK